MGIWTPEYKCELRSLGPHRGIQHAIIAAAGNLGKARRIMDDNSNGLVSKTEFFQGLKSLKIPYYEIFNLNEDQLFKVLDDDGNQELTMPELLGEDEDHIDQAEFEKLPFEQKIVVYNRRARLLLKQEMMRKPGWEYQDSEQEMRHIFQQAASREYHDQITQLMQDLFKKGERRREVVGEI